MSPHSTQLTLFHAARLILFAVVLLLSAPAAPAVQVNSFAAAPGMPGDGLHIACWTLNWYD